MFKSGIDDVKLARELLRHVRFQGKNKYKKYNDLKKRIHKELNLDPCPNYANIYTFWWGIIDESGAMSRPRFVHKIKSK